ncbi:MAG: branched-chain amino acid transport system II carrier protein [Priestia megaterium]
MLILTGIDDFFKNYLPLYNQGLGWLIPTVIAAFIGYIISIARGTHHTDHIQRKAS